MAVQPEILAAHDEDRELVAAFQAGDDAAFTRIVQAHYSALLAHARRKLGSIPDAEDAVQEALLRAYRALDRFAGEFRLAGWLHRILSNVCADISERRYGEVRLRDRLATRRDEVPAVEDELQDVRLQRIVREAIASLPESYRVAFVLRELEHKPYAEVAETMAVTEQNARARVHRARSALARTLRDVGAVLGTAAIPIRLAASRRLFTRLTPAGPLSAAPAPDAFAAQSGNVSQIGALAGAPVAQALAQAASTPLGQTLLAAAPDAGRSALPVAGALATLAAGAAAAVMPAVTAQTLNITNLVPAAVGAPSSVSTSGLRGALASYEGSQSSSQDATSGGATTESTTSGGAQSAPPAQVPPTLVGADLWTWVTGAGSAATPPPAGAEQAGGSGATTTGTDSTDNSSAPPGTTFGSASGCPLAQSLVPVGDSTMITVPPPEPAGTAVAGELATDPVHVQTGATTFSANAPGSATNGSATGSIDATIGACTTGAEVPVVVADLTPQGTDATGGDSTPIFQVTAAMVGSSSSPDETDTFYRGTAQWISGPDAGEAPVPLVAEVVTKPSGDGHGDTAVLLVAFFAPTSGLVPVPATPDAPSASGSTAPTNASTDPSSTSGGTTPDTSATGTSSGTDPTATTSTSNTSSTTSSSSTG